MVATETCQSVIFFEMIVCIVFCSCLFLLYISRIPKLSEKYECYVKNPIPDVVYLFGLAKPKDAWNSPDVSPFVIKLEMFLRCANIRYEKIVLNMPRKGPKVNSPEFFHLPSFIAIASLLFPPLIILLHLI